MESSDLREVEVGALLLFEHGFDPPFSLGLELLLLDPAVDGVGEIFFLETVHEIGLAGFRGVQVGVPEFRGELSEVVVEFFGYALIEVEVVHLEVALVVFIGPEVGDAHRAEGLLVGESLEDLLEEHGVFDLNFFEAEFPEGSAALAELLDDHLEALLAFEFHAEDLLVALRFFPLEGAELLVEFEVRSFMGRQAARRSALEVLALVEEFFDVFTEYEGVLARVLVLEDVVLLRALEDVDDEEFLFPLLLHDALALGVSLENAAAPTTLTAAFLVLIIVSSFARVPSAEYSEGECFEICEGFDRGLSSFGEAIVFADF